MTVKYWVIDAGDYYGTDEEDPGKLRDLGSLVYYLAVGDGVLRARYDAVAQKADMDAVGRIKSVDSEDGVVTVDWRPAEFEITPSPNGRRHWKKQYFPLDAKRARAYELPARFAEAFGDLDWLSHKITDGFVIRNDRNGDRPSLQVEEGYVYLMQWKDEYKIGKAVEVERRQKRLALELDRDITLLHTIFSTDYTRAELELHRKFEDKCLHGEWFALDQDDVAWLMSIDRI
ncbi:MAG: GIY-YIG nuclease family protein [Actinomycetota bacterium]|nr:GIY-YIG nuclease family protein [Actinomycetota bacterium]